MNYALRKSTWGQFRQLLPIATVQQLEEAIEELYVDARNAATPGALQRLLDVKAATQPADDLVRPFPTVHDMQRTRFTAMWSVVAAALIGLVAIVGLFYPRPDGAGPSSAQVKQEVLNDLGVIDDGGIVGVTAQSTLDKAIADKTARNTPSLAKLECIIDVVESNRIKPDATPLKAEDLCASK